MKTARSVDNLHPGKESREVHCPVVQSLSATSELAVLEATGKGGVVGDHLKITRIKILWNLLQDLD